MGAEALRRADKETWRQGFGVRQYGWVADELAPVLVDIRAARHLSLRAIAAELNLMGYGQGAVDSVRCRM